MKYELIALYDADPEKALQVDRAMTAYTKVSLIHATDINGTHTVGWHFNDREEAIAVGRKVEATFTYAHVEVHDRPSEKPATVYVSSGGIPPGGGA